MAAMLGRALTRLPMLALLRIDTAGEGEDEQFYQLMAADARRRQEEAARASKQPKLPGIVGLPAADPLVEVVVRAPAFGARPIGAPSFISPAAPTLLEPQPIGAPGLPRPVGEPAQAVRPRPRPVPAPVTQPLPLPVLLPLPGEFPLNVPETRPQPRPKPSPAPTIPIPGLPPIKESPRLTLPQPSPVPYIGPVPLEEADKCNCPKPKKRKPRQPRTECKTGTYTQTAKSIIYRPRRKIICR